MIGGSPDRFVRYPFSARLTVNARAGRSGRAIRMLGGTSDWRRSALDRVGSTVIGLTGTHRLPPTTPWPWPDCQPGDLVDALHEALPGLTIVAAAAPRQSGRRRLSVLARSQGRDVVVKLGRTNDGLETETQVLRLLSDTALPGIATPHVLAAGVLELVDPVAFIATGALGLHRQRPALDEPLRTFEADLGERLQSLERPVGTAADAVPTHGDLAPWNLRRTSRGLALFDWESAGWGPPGSDLAHYRRARRGTQSTTTVEGVLNELLPAASNACACR